MIKIGQIGIGHNHAEAKMKAIRKFPELFEVVGFAEEDAQWLQKRGNLPAYEGLKRYSVEELITKCDVLLVETDVWDLTGTAQKCINAGKHIHMDKPASGTLAEYKHLLDTAKEKNLVVQLGYMYRYNPSVNQVFDMVKRGELGSVHSVNAEMSTFHSNDYRKWLNHFPGGTMYIFGSHLIDLIVLLLGKPNRISSEIVASGLGGVDAPDVTCANLIYENAIARVFVSSVERNGWGRRCFSVAGSKGTAEIRPLEVPVRMTFAEGGTGMEYFEDYAKEVSTEAIPDTARYDEMIKDLYAFVKGERENPFSYEHEYLVQEVLDKVVGGIGFYENP